MKATKTSLLLLLSNYLSVCSSSSFTRRGTVPSRRTFTRLLVDNRRNNSVKKVGAHDVLKNIRRGGQQSSAPESYHGNYVAQAGEGPPKAATENVVPSVSTATSAVQQTVSSPAPSRPVLASATSANSKLSNLQERTGPAVLMLGAVYLLLKFTGTNGLIGLVFAMQLGMYSESTNVVESYNKKGDNADGIVSFPLQKWWWFATAMMFTSGRKMISEYTSMSMDQMNLITFGMSAISLVGGVIQLAVVNSPDAEDIYRRYLGKVACCHFSLLFLVGQSSFWVNTVKEYGLVWVLFPALLVVVNDTMAYVFGVLMGKHKLLPRLSPKKTVEGFVGAGLSTLAVAAPLLKRMIGKDTSIANIGKHALALALYVSLVSPFGGFLASAVKRAHGAKDFGALIPGHGGVVDRFDCQVVTAPFVYLYLKNYLSVAAKE